MFSDKITPKEKIDSLTSLRGIAAWWVVIYHFRESLIIDGFDYSFLGSGGYLAVDVFFVLSGFVIYLNYQDKFKKINLLSVKRFLALRLARIYPLYITLLIAYLVNPLVIIYFSSSGNILPRYTIEYYLASILMVQNWGFFDYIAWNIPAWSISAEFAAYIFFPVIFYIAGKTNWIGATVLLFLTLASIPSLCTLYDLTFLGDNIPHFGMVRCCLEFSCGVFLAKIRMEKTVSTINLQKYFAFSLIALAIILYKKIPDYYYIPGFSVLAIGLLTIKETWQSQFLENKTLVKIGEISYSTYLVHYLVKDWIKFISPDIGFFSFILYIVLVLFFSLVLFKFIEAPGRQFFTSKINAR